VSDECVEQDCLELFAVSGATRFSGDQIDPSVQALDGPAVVELVRLEPVEDEVFAAEHGSHESLEWGRLLVIVPLHQRRS